MIAIKETIQESPYALKWINEDGTITSAANDDMFPFLPAEEYRAVKEYLKGDKNE